MDFSEAIHKDFRYWHLPHITQRGVFHGFGGATLDVRYGSEQWGTAFPQGPELHLLEQVHGSAYALCGEGGSVQEADAWLQDSEIEAAAFGIRTADCVPVLLFSQKGNAALHCGWRGVLGGLLPRILGEFSKRGVDSEDIQLAIGPHARSCCYEIGSDLEAKIIEQSLVSREKIIRDEANSGKMYCELSVLLREQAGRAGISEKHCFEHYSCTICSNEFFSFRRQKELAGRQLSFISARNLSAETK